MSKFFGSLKPPVLATAPSSPVQGQIYFDSVKDTLFFYDGSAWIDAEGGDLSFAFSQGVAANTWVISHGLGKVPSISVFTSANDTVEPGSVTITDLNHLTLHFTASFSGYAYLN